MPPRTRACKATKIQKENICAVVKTKTKVVVKDAKVNKQPRKVLGDKTNSASDDNASVVEVLKTGIKKALPVGKSKKQTENDDKSRLRRDRRLPNRFVENKVLNNLSNSKEHPSPIKSESVVKVTSKSSDNSDNISPFKSPLKLNGSITVSRPRRVCRLPSKFEDHSISPSKFIPVQPVHASTPIVQHKRKPASTPKEITHISVRDSSVTNTSNHKSNLSTSSVTITTAQKNSNKNKSNNFSKPSSDTNNNANRLQTRSKVELRTRKSNTAASTPHLKKALRTRKKAIVTATKVNNSQKSINISKSVNKITNFLHKSPTKRVLKPKPMKKTSGANNSYRLLHNKLDKSVNNPDVYEFTYDPKDEPPPQKKKRKRVVRKKPAKPKTVVMKNNYNHNLSKSLNALKDVVSKKASQIERPQIERPMDIKEKETATSNADNVQPSIGSLEPPVSDNIHSIQLEEIAADFEPSEHHDINYSPVHEPVPHIDISIREKQNDPLNLRDNISFFDDHPVASSSMNVSVRHPEASPWRVEFESLPLKWPVNSYVKPNMTPAVECSFINFHDNQKKHVYTNMLPNDESFAPPVVEAPNLKQSSIISFIRDAALRSANKKKRDKSATPIKANSLFEDISSTSIDRTTKQVVSPRKENPSNNVTPEAEVTVDNVNASDDKENRRVTRKRKNNSDNNKPAKTPRKENDDTFFGFNDSENQENISPKVDANKVRELRPRARMVLKQINDQAGPMRVAIPLAPKPVNPETVQKLYEEMKSVAATDAPMLPEKVSVENVEPTEMEKMLYDEDDDDESVHLFEDIKVVHHLKPTHKSYSKAKKVTFRQRSTSDSDIIEDRNQNDSSDEDHLRDLTFELPAKKKITRKKATKKQKLNKKEEQEAEAWAANFNSMCEDIDDFPLVVE